jgi:aminopeptidase YwaD
MLKDIVSAIQASYSGRAAKEDVAAISRFHRIQASPGYRAAAAYLYEELQRAGLVAQVESYPANYQTHFWEAGSFQEWDASSATLHLIEPAGQARKLADYRALKLSLIQRSAPFSGEAEVILLENGLKETDYEGIDVSGKIVLTDAPVDSVRQLAVNRFDAIGILFDGMREAPPVREAMDLPDARQYTSFWWSGRPEEKDCFGFVLSPRQGSWLRKLIHKREASGKPTIKVRAEVEARFYDGHIEVVTALIPGASEETVMLVSHLCHPQPSANDNASGAAANLEAARTLQNLVSSGELARPHRSIRFLWMPEMTGTYAYLSRHEDEIGNMVAGLNLDMVGEDQTKTGSVLLLERPPDASASFAPDLIERIREMLLNEVQTHTGLSGYSLVRQATTNFSGGSDHYIFSDPTVGVPMPMMIQWPDKFYHTSADTLDKVDPNSLTLAGTISAAYAYFVANAGRRETSWLAHEMQARFRARLARFAQDQMMELWESEEQAQMLASLESKMNYQLDRHRVALGSTGRLWDGAGTLIDSLSKDASSAAGRELERARKAVVEHFGMNSWEPEGRSKLPDQWERLAAEMIPQRHYRGPGMAIGKTAELSSEDRAAWQELLEKRKSGAHTIPVLAEYWADGRRTALEIVELIEMETGIRDAELVVNYFDLLQKLGLVSYE